MNLQGNRREVKELRTKIVAAIVAATNFHTKKSSILTFWASGKIFSPKNTFSKFSPSCPTRSLGILAHREA